MGRYLGPKHRVCRRAGEKLCDAARCPSQRRSYPPGMHGPRLRKKVTEYGAQLLEKQKLRMIYGIMERQLRKYYDDALRVEGNTSELLVAKLERRLDNVVFRLGFVKTRAAARQAVSHGHITVNGKKLNIPSYTVKVDDVIGIRERKKASSMFQDYAQVAAAISIPAWLAAEPATHSGRVIRMPEIKDAQPVFRTQSIVEFYSR
ncbi:MAG: 30S ribosomal protein S4 [bacterium]|nr:30S ribosomal protein S4 [bacterium]